MKQTAVEWLLDQIQGVHENSAIAQQAKEMEKEQQGKLGILLAMIAEEIGEAKLTELLKKAEQYYNEIYKK
jgi:hypothetical protein